MALCCHTMPSRNEASSVFLYMSIILLSYISLLNADIVVVDSENTTVDVFIDFELSFSSRISDEGIQGMIALADPEDACEKLSPPPFDLNGTLRWFVLIKRYPCALETKVQHAKDAHYGGAVIYNKEPGGPQRLVPSGRLSLASDIGIPAVLIGYDDGRSIKSQYLYDKGFTLVIYPESPFNINAYLLPFASVVGSCLFIMVVFMIVKCIKDRRRSRRNRLSSRHLKQLPTTKYKKGDQYDVCAICLEEYNEGEKLRILPCSHAYHNKCIDPWLTNNKRTCPVCKRKVALSGCSSDSDSDSELDLPSETTPLLRNAFRRGGNQVSTSGGTFENSAASASGRHAAGTSTEEAAAASQQIQGMQTTQVDFHSSSEEPQQQRRHGRRRQQWPRSGCTLPFDAPSPASVNGEHPGNEEDSSSADSSSVEIRSGSSSSETSQPSTSSLTGGGSKSRSAKKPELVV